MKDYWELKVRDEFSAAHALRHYQGKCERTHGHNFSVEVCVGGCELDPATHILLDFKTLKDSLKQALATLDHAFLNELEIFGEINPSSENIARAIWRNLAEILASSPDLRASKVALKYVEVSEKSSQSAVYRPFDGD
ncbi:MAG: 6-carboxytetrahydropterin synthase QueD [Desulfovibrio sp.]|nr:6-carboxytetrahydropterin synthase QueD [Desulfovibrio sp.]